MKTKLRFYGDDATGFHARKLPDPGTNYICWSVKITVSVLKKVENNYTQVSLKECKYIEKKIRYVIVT